MDDEERIVSYAKVQNGVLLHCRVHISADGSALVEGDGGLEILYEEDASDEAIADIENMGYVRLTDSDDMVVKRIETSPRDGEEENSGK